VTEATIGENSVYSHFSPGDVTARLLTGSGYRQQGSALAEKGCNISDSIDATGTHPMRLAARRLKSCKPILDIIKKDVANANRPKNVE
jgi:hypothetical protein